jgi:hypothetical protein
MRCALAFLSAILLLAMPGSAAGQVKNLGDLAHHNFEAAFPGGGHLDLHIRSGEIHIVGSDEDKIIVRVSGKRGSESTDINGRFERTGDLGKLRVTGGPSNDVTITVQVPKNSNLIVRVFAGDLDVTGISGDKDIKLGAGDLTIGVGPAADYAQVSASVSTGDINAGPFGESQGGLFRSFAKTGPGRYKLVAHVGAGDLMLQ